MEQLNRIELRGIVGNARTQNVGEQSVTRFSVATDYLYKAKDGTPVVETTWHNCTAWSSTAPDADKLERGKGVHLMGRLHLQRFVDANGIDRTITEVLVQSLKIL